MDCTGERLWFIIGIASYGSKKEFFQLILLQVKELAKSFGVDEIFTGVNFIIEPGEKLGLVGPNGAGKTTLFRCITGEEQPDSGEIIIADKINLGYLEQMPDYPEGTTLMDVVMEVFADLLNLREQLRELEYRMGETHEDKLERVMESYAKLTEEYERSGGFSCEAMARRVTSGLGFSEKDLKRTVAEFSGGEKTRASLARLLTREPDLLLLDEPTNHLDLEAVEWLESYLKGYKGSVLLISHDRYFLDEVTNKTLELSFGHLAQYPGNYSTFQRLKEEQETALARAYEKQQKEIKATEEYISKYRAGIKSKQARGRQSQLNRLERLQGPKSGPTLNLSSDGQVASSGNMVTEGLNLSVSYGEKTLFKGIDLQINRGEKVALVGANGVGKSTLLKLLIGLKHTDQGSIRLGSRVKIGYYDQEHADLNPENRVIDELMYHFALPDYEARDYLGAVLFRGDDVFKRVGDLSGGEKGRLSFLKLILSKPNFLVLDEPTNHLDIASKQVIEDYLQDFSGTILMVSHDRYFMDRIVNRVVELNQGRLNNFAGDYSYYKEKKAEPPKNSPQPKVVVDAAPKQTGEERPKINKAKTREQISRLELEIEGKEARLNYLTELLADSTTYQDEDKARELVNEYKQLELAIPEAYAEWERLSDLLAAN
ncbi:MAG TPA: ABC-F family ATP-binding cassette domain-containing protein [Candidatus Deferrimicrobium sp.]|nr:ABC-F family ATP-binding cassette domain-containing protein [Candidatus Deferrimicrobium sp.]